VGGGEELRGKRKGDEEECVGQQGEEGGGEYGGKGS